MVSTNDIRPGQSIIVDDVIYQIMEYAHVKPGKGKAFVKTKLKNMKDGGIIEKTFRADENVEHFMNFVSVDSWGSQAEYLRRGLDFNRMWEHVDQFLTEIPGRNSITFIITYNNLTKCLDTVNLLKQ